jgi:hypothetical protein
MTPVCRPASVRTAASVGWVCVIVRRRTGYEAQRQEYAIAGCAQVLPAESQLSCRSIGTGCGVLSMPLKAPDKNH